MFDPSKYTIHLDAKFQPLEIVDVPSVVEACRDRWYNQTLTQVNDSVVRVAVVQGEYHWHKHDDDDEFFFVLSGHLSIDFHDRTVELTPLKGITVPKGVMHRPRAAEKTVMLMVETSSIVPTGSELDA